MSDIPDRLPPSPAGEQRRLDSWLETLADGQNLPMPKDILVRVIHTLIEGLVLQRLLTPELFPDEVFYAAFAVLAAAQRRQT